MKARALSALESGQILFFPNLAFVLSGSEKQFLDAGVSDGKAKNISLDPASGKMQASSLSGEKADELAAMIERFGRQAAQLVHGLLPYTHVERARTSFRPVEVKGRHYSKVSDDRLLHIDAFPSRPMQGRESCAFSPMSRPPRRATGMWANLSRISRATSCRACARIGPANPGFMTKWASPMGGAACYDELMLSLHDAAKLDSNFQQNSPHQAISFPPGPAGWSSPTWCCTPRLAGNSPWNRHSISIWRNWPNRSGRRSGCWSG